MASIVQRSLMVILSAVLAVVLVVVLMAWTFQERIAFQPPGPPYPDANAFRRVEYSANDGQRLFAFLAGDPSISRGLVIAFHGNADVAARMIDWGEEVSRRTGLAVMVAEYRGYMGIPGRPTYEGVLSDAEAAYTFAHETLGLDDGRLAYFGHSLGSAVAADLAKKHAPRTLILESPFTSAQEMAARMVGSWFTSTLWPLVSRLHFDTDEIVKSLDVPVAVAHGGRDFVVPPRMGERVYTNAKVKGPWLFIPRAGHNDLRIAGGDEYWKWITDALLPLTSSK